MDMSSVDMKGAGATAPVPASIFRCDNPGCRVHLGVDHVTLITTCHVRRFCSVECITDGHRAVLDEIWRRSREF